MLQEGWHDQYERMGRSHQWFVDCATGRSGAGSNVTRDSLYHFFEDAYHLKDWLKNDPSVTIPAAIVEEAVKSYPLNVCADLCNGIKHLKLTKTKTGNLDTAVTSQSVVVHVGSHSEHSWTVESAGDTWDAEDVANDVISAWDTWLQAHTRI